MKIVGWILLAFVAGCGSGQTGATATGGSCAESSSCAGGLCLQSGDFPGGYCSAGCDPGNATSCAAGSVCIDDASGAPADSGAQGVCYQLCERDSDCTRAGFGCREKSSHMVCRDAR